MCVVSEAEPNNNTPINGPGGRVDNLPVPGQPEEL